MINRYDKPAEQQFINTYVPMPFQQMQQMAQTAENRIKSNMEAFGQAEAAIQNLRGIPNTTDAKRANEIVSGVTNLVNDYATKDLLDPFIATKFKSDLNKIANPAEIRAISESRQMWEKNEKLKDQLRAKGLYSEALDLMDPARNPDFYSMKNGIYGYSSRPRTDPNAWAKNVFGFAANKGVKLASGIDPETGEVYNIHGWTLNQAKDIISRGFDNLVAQQGTKDLMAERLYNKGYSPEEIQNVLNNPDKYKDLYVNELYGLGEQFTWNKEDRRFIPRSSALGGGAQTPGQFDQPFSWDLRTNITKEEGKELKKDPLSLYEQKSKEYESQSSTSQKFGESTLNILAKSNDEYNGLDLDAAYNKVYNKFKSGIELSKEEGRLLNSMFQKNRADNSKLEMESAVNSVKELNRRTIESHFADPFSSPDGKTVYEKAEELLPGIQKLFAATNVSSPFYSQTLNGRYSDEDFVKKLIDSSLEYFKENIPKHAKDYVKESLPDKSWADMGSEILRDIIGEDELKRLYKEDKVNAKLLISGAAEAMKTIYTEAVAPTMKFLGNKNDIEDVRGIVKTVDSDPMITLQNTSNLYSGESTKYSYYNTGDDVLKIILDSFASNINGNDYNVEEWKKINPSYSGRKGISKVKEEFENGERVILKDKPTQFKFNSETGEITMYVPTGKVTRDSSGKERIDQYGTSATLPIRLTEKGVNNYRELLSKALAKKGNMMLAHAIDEMPATVKDIKYGVNYAKGETWSMPVTKYNKDGSKTNLGNIAVIYDKNDATFKGVVINNDGTMHNIITGTLSQVSNAVAQAILQMKYGLK